jgi:hypothetical protein
MPTPDMVDWDAIIPGPRSQNLRRCESRSRWRADGARAQAGEL